MVILITLRNLLCPDCTLDTQVACPRDVDAVCRHCRTGYCAHHILPHLQEKHQVAVEWRGFLKDA